MECPDVLSSFPWMCLVVLAEAFGRLRGSYYLMGAIIPTLQLQKLRLIKNT